MSVQIWVLVLTSLTNDYQIPIKMYETQAACVIARIADQQNIDALEASGRYQVPPGTIHVHCEVRDIK
jgi:hypothetical protein